MTGILIDLWLLSRPVGEV